jgi:hypothetical protein
LDSTRPTDPPGVYQPCPAAPLNPVVLTQLQLSRITLSSWTDGISFGGYSPNSDEAPEQYSHRIYSTSSDSSSVYSQPEWELDPQRPENISTTSIAAATSTDHSQYIKDSSDDNESYISTENQWYRRLSHGEFPHGKLVKDVELVADPGPKAPSPRRDTDPILPRSLVENATTMKLVRGYEGSLRSPNQDLPSPSTVRPLQSKKPENLVIKRSPFFDHVRDSIGRGNVGVTSPSQRHLSSSSSGPKKSRINNYPAESPAYNEHLATSKSPMKSPFSPSWNLPSPHHTEHKDRPKLLSGTTRTPKPDTPTSPKSGLMSELSETLQIWSWERRARASTLKGKT